MREISVMKFEDCGSCQKHCVFCAHDGMMAAYNTYQLSMGELQKFIDCTKQSDLVIKELAVHGMGEPTLWKHFNEGIILIKRSGVAGKIVVTTNGLLLDRIEGETWKCIDRLDVSLYSDYNRHEMLNEHKHRYKDKIRILHEDGANYISSPVKVYKNKIPCICLCPGPMFVKDRIFFYCAPPVFDAAKLGGVETILLIQALLLPGRQAY